MIKKLFFQSLVIFLIIFAILCADTSSKPITTSPINRYKYDQDYINNKNTITQENSVNANFPDDFGSVQINKEITPKFSDFYIPNKSYLVHIRISGIGRILENISIKEDVTSAMKIKSFKIYPCIVDPFNELSSNNISEVSSEDKNRSINVWKENYSLKNNCIYIKINRLKPKRYIEYEYELVPLAIGIYCDLTTLRIGGEASKFPDMLNKIELDVREPTYEIALNKIDPYGYINTPLNATYNIIHTAGSWEGLLNLYVSFNNTSNYNVSYNSRNISIIPFKTCPINITIYYRNSGLQPLPPIRINNKIYTLDEQNIFIYTHKLFRLAEDYQIFNVTSFMLALSAFILYVIRKIDNKLKKIINLGSKDLNEIDSDLKGLTEIAKVIEKRKPKIKIKYIYRNIGDYEEDPNMPHWWKEIHAKN
jgi:hypothetical protein